MKIVTYRSQRGERAGLLRNGGVVDIWSALGGGGASVRDLLESGRLSELAELSDATVTEMDAVELAAPVPDPDKIVCIGLNYKAHAAEAGIEPPDAPTFFAKFRNALAAPGTTVALPAASDKVDFEAEVALVIGERVLWGQRGRRARLHRRLHAAQRPLGARPAVRDPAVDAGQGVRRIGPVRACSGHPR